MSSLDAALQPAISAAGRDRTAGPARAGTFAPPAASDQLAAVQTPCDQDLIQTCLAGSTDAFGVLVGRYQHRLHHALFHALGSAEDAQDVLQEAFVQAYLKLATFRGQAGFYSWLFRIAMNTAISSRRRLRHPTSSIEALREKTGAEPSDHRPASAPNHALDVAEQQRVVREALAQVTEEFRICLVLKEMDGLSYEEIAGIVGCPIGTVRSRIHRGRTELRELLQALLGPDET